MQSWTLQNIRDKVRKLTGRTTTGNMSDTDLDRYINEYYQNTLILEVPGVKEMVTAVTTVTSIGNQKITLAMDYALVLGPVSINYTPANLVTRDKEYFYSLWSKDTANEPTGQPTDILIGGDSGYDLILRPIPDAVYQFRYHTIKFPLVAMSSSGSELSGLYGRLIATGAAIDALIDHGQFETAQALTGVYDTFLNLARRAQIRELMHEQPVPTW